MPCKTRGRKGGYLVAGIIGLAVVLGVFYLTYAAMGTHLSWIPMYIRWILAAVFGGVFGWVSALMSTATPGP
jgi:hypothetical protein